MRIFHTHGARLDALDAIRSVAELKDVAREALNRKVFVQGANESVRRFENHAIV